MNIKDFDDLLKLLKEKAIIQNNNYKLHNIKEHYKNYILPNLESQERDKFKSSKKFIECKEKYKNEYFRFGTINDFCYNKLKDDLESTINNLNENIPNDILAEIRNTIKLYDSPQYNDIMEYLENDFKNLTDRFKRNLIKFYNEYFTDLFNEHWMKDFYLLKDIISTYLELNYQRKEYNLPFQDNQKYNKRIDTLNKKKNWTILPKLQSYERIKFFQHNAKELININSLILFSKVKREKEKYQNELIFELILIITDENYKRNIPNNMRLTKKTSSIFNNELQEYEELLKNKSIKKYYLKP